MPTEADLKWWSLFIIYLHQTCSSSQSSLFRGVVGRSASHDVGTWEEKQIHTCSNGESPPSMSFWPIKSWLITFLLILEQFISILSHSHNWNASYNEYCADVGFSNKITLQIKSKWYILLISFTLAISIFVSSYFAHLCVPSTVWLSLVNQLLSLFLCSNTKLPRCWREKQEIINVSGLHKSPYTISR